MDRKRNSKLHEVLTGLKTIISWCEYCMKHDYILDERHTNDVVRYADAAYKWILQQEDDKHGKQDGVAVEQEEDDGK